MTWLWIIATLAVLSVLAYQRASLIIWSITAVVWMGILTKFSTFVWPVIIILWLLTLLMVLFNITPLRKNFISRQLFAIYRKIMPAMSDTEREAIAAGTVQWAGELFSGSPNWNGMLQRPGMVLSEEEQAFLDGPVEELCDMIDDWDITHNRADIPPKVWKFIKDNGFFGMIVPKAHGGLEFSAAAHARIISKVASTSITVASTIAVPNSLGPAELLHKYGTQEQKDHYLSRLARGEEIPCFALTGPEAGSDASTLPDTGIVCKGKFEGKEILGIKLNFSKRYITLAPVSTVIGLAFKMYDPDHLLGDKEDIGITVALVPSKTKGISIGRRHYPLNIVFQNGPIHGKDVFIPLDWIIGGQEKAGKGWHMLVECLSVGRGITLPSISVGGAKVASMSTGAYSRIRKQFGLPIGKFEGIEEALARIAGNTYLTEAMRDMTVAAIDRGEKPAVLTAIVKYHSTERARSVAMDAMDVHGGKGICLGPKNYLGRGYQGAPISITVEGANILTRSMIIFGQGAMRCHPYVLHELNAAHNPDKKQGLHQFDRAIFSHIGFIVTNFARSLLLGLSHGWLSCPGKVKAGKRYVQMLNRFSSAFAFVTDIAMMSLGGDLKRKESLSARLGDVLSYLFIGSAVIKRYHEQGLNAEDKPLFDWACQDTLYRIQTQLDGIIQNFPNRWLAALMRCVVFPLGRCLRQPSDKLNHKLASILIQPNAARDRLGHGIYYGTKGASPMSDLEDTLKEVIAIEPLEKVISKAEKAGTISGYNWSNLVDNAVAAGVITAEEGKTWHRVHAKRMAIINVDDFDPKDLTHGESEPVKQEP